MAIGGRLLAQGKGRAVKGLLMLGGERKSEGIGVLAQSEVAAGGKGSGTRLGSSTE